MLLASFIAIGGASVAVIVWLLFFADGEPSSRSKSPPSEADSGTTPQAIFAELLPPESKKRAA